MDITPAGYLVFAILILAITLSVFVNKRINRESDSPKGCVGGAYIGLIVISITSLFITSLWIFSTQAYSLVVYPKYESTIVDVNSEWVEQDYTDSDGFTRSETVEMHTAVLEFYDDDNKLLRLNNSISSGDKPRIGDKVTIAYHDGKLVEFSLRSFLILVALAVMMILLGSISTCFVLYALNKDITRVREFAWSFVFNVVIPASMFFMMCAMLYALWDHHTNNGDMPVWAQGVSIFFAIVLAITLISYFKRLLKELKKAKNKT